MFEKFLSRLNIYDFFGVLMSGICITAVSLFLQKLMGINIELIKNETFAFFFLSYIIGLIFQEFSSSLQRKIFQRNNKLLSKAIDHNQSYYLHLEKYEEYSVSKYIKEKLLVKVDGVSSEEGRNTETSTNIEVSTNIIYNYCKNYMAKYGNMIGCNRNQAIAGMARSLSLYFFLAPLFFLSLLSPYGNLIFPIWVYIVITGVLILLSIFFYFRFKRFTLLRIIAIYRYFLYNQVWGEKDNSRCKEKKEKNRGMNQNND